jgi:hypothetical protein
MERVIPIEGPHGLSDIQGYGEGEGLYILKPWFPDGDPFRIECSLSAILLPTGAHSKSVYVRTLILNVVLPIVESKVYRELNIRNTQIRCLGVLNRQQRTISMIDLLSP